MQKPHHHIITNTAFSALILIAAFLLAIFFYFHYSAPKIILGDGIKGPKGMVWVPGGEFVMGSESRLAKANEKPAHKVRVDGFWMDQTHVTNDQFAAFVKATGYVTTAEQKSKDKTIIPGAKVFIGTNNPVPLNDESQWWQFVPGANWDHPQGPKSNIIGRGDYPVVQ